AVELRSALQSAESSQRGFVLTGNEIYLSPYDSAKTAAKRQLDTLKRMLATSADLQPMLHRLGTVMDGKSAEMAQNIELQTERRDEDLQALLRSNRGKALMDEANVFLSGIERAADQRLTQGVSEQRANAEFLRLVSIAGAGVIVLVVGGVIVT